MATIANTVIQLIKDKRGWTDEMLHQITTPSVTDLHDPFLLEHSNAFIDHLHQAQHKSVTIIPDYDADGILSGSLLAAALSVFGFDTVNVYTPRIQTGYGISVKSAKEALTRFPGTELIVTTDNGSNAFAGIDYANEQGVDVLVSDHHKAGLTDPTLISVNPNRPSDDYPFKGLSGTGVIWKLMQAYAKTYGTAKEQLLIDHLVVLVGISAISDVMPLLDENRYIVQKAVERLQDASFLKFGAACEGSYGSVFRGLYALHTVCAANKKFDYGFDESTLGFVFGPMLNSPRRMSGTSKSGFALFLNDSEQDALEHAKALFGTNEERKDLMRRYGRQYMSPILPAVDKTGFMLSVVPFRPGLIGLLAGQFTNQFNLPAIVFGGQALNEIHFGGPIDPAVIPVLSGSGRSPEWFNLHNALTSISAEYPDMFRSFGGHPMAAGVAIYTQHYELFQEAFQKRVLERIMAINEELLAQTEQDPDAVRHEDDTVWLGLSLKDSGDIALTTRQEVLEMVDVLDFVHTLKPFGHGFAEPSFGVSFSTNDVFVGFMGAEKQHVKFTCPNGLVLIQWNGAEALRQQLGQLAGPFVFKAKGLLSVNEFRDNQTVQVIVNQLVVV